MQDNSVPLGVPSDMPPSIPVQRPWRESTINAQRKGGESNS